MEQKDYTKIVPAAPPADIVEWLHENKKLTDEYIVYRADWWTEPLTGVKQKVVQCTCSACGSSYIEQRVELKDGACAKFAPAPFGYFNSERNQDVMSGDMTTCEECGKEVEAIHVRSIQTTKNVNNAWPLAITKIDDRIVLTGWRIAKVLWKSGQTDYECYGYETYVVEDKNLIRLVGYWKNYSRIVFCDGWAQRKKYRDTWGLTPTELIYPWQPEILNGTSLENSKLDLYLNRKGKVVPVSYCNLYLKHKNVENLVMQGMGDLINYKLDKLAEGYGHQYKEVGPLRLIEGINWKKSKPNEMLGLTREEYRYAIKHSWYKDEIDRYNAVKMCGTRPEEMKELAIVSSYYLKRFGENYPSENPVKATRYLEKQNKKYNASFNLDYVLDYWDMLRAVGEDFADADTKYPQNINRAHDVLATRVKYAENKELKKKFKLRAAALERYSFEADDLLIRPAASERELIAEGKVLHHCVGGYARRHAEGSTAILFIRRKTEPDMPFFTLELDESRLIVRQNRGCRNCDRTEEVTAFEEKWLEYIRSEAKKGKETTTNGRISKKSAA